MKLYPEWRKAGIEVAVAVLAYTVTKIGISLRRLQSREIRNRLTGEYGVKILIEPLSGLVRQI